MLHVVYSGQFKRDVKKMKKRGKSIEKLKRVLSLLINGENLPQFYHDHPLKGNFVGFRDLHIEPDWILIYKISQEYVRFERTGTHADLFD